MLCTMLAPAASSSAAVAVRVASASAVVIDAVSVDIAGAIDSVEYGLCGFVGAYGSAIDGLRESDDGRHDGLFP